MPAAVLSCPERGLEVLMTAVMIGVDPHKGSHTAVAVSAAEEPLGKLRVRGPADQAGRLVGWAAKWPERTWAAAGAGGLGHLLDWQLVAAGELVLDVQPKLAAGVRLLDAGDSSKNDPDDAAPVAVAALRSRTRRPVRADDHAEVLKVWSRRHRDLGRAKNQAACRLHAVVRAGARRRARPGRSPRLRLPASQVQLSRTAPPGRPAPASPPKSWRTCAAWTSRRPGRRRSSHLRSARRAPA
jgi:hypothetical protein